MVHVSHPDDAKSVLLNTKRFVKMPMADKSLFTRMFGKNVGIVEGEDWKAQRHIINPVFYDLSLFFEAFASTSDYCLEKWQQSVGNNRIAKIDVANQMTKLTIDILGKAVFDHDFKALDNKLDEFYVAYQFLLDNTFTIFDQVIPAIWDIPTANNKRIKIELKKLWDMLSDIVADAKTKLDEGYQRKSLLDLMLRSKDEATGFVLSDYQLKANVNGFLFAGHDTTAVTLGYQLYVLARDQDIQQKCYEEIERVVGDGELEYEQLSQLDYLLMFIKESMRMYGPALSILPRVVTENCQLGGFNIPAGSLVNIDIHAMHHNPKFFPEPFTFNPDRFQPEVSRNMHKFSYLPFGGGVRVCAGNNFSLMEQKVFLVKLLQKFHIKLEDGYDHVTHDTQGFMQKIGSDCRIVITPRK
jgi:cytochrome P450